MRAITLESLDSGPTLQEIPTPQIAPNEVLVRVRASSVNPVDNAIASGMLKDMVEHEFPVVLGRDFAGVVEQAGSDVSDLSVGDEVLGFVPVVWRFLALRSLPTFFAPMPVPSFARGGP